MPSRNGWIVRWPTDRQGWLDSLIVKKLPNYLTTHLPNWRQRRPAFSLIEVLVALFLLSAITLLLVSSAGSLHTRRRTDLVALADKAATKEIERIRNLDFASVTPASSLPCDTEFNTELQNCRIDRTVNNFAVPPASPDPNLKQVIINLNYSYQGVTRFVTMETLITPGGL